MAVAFGVAHSVFLYALPTAGRDRRFLAIVGGGLVLNIVLNLVLIPFASATGAAAAMAVTEAGIACAAYLSWRSAITRVRSCAI